MTIPTIIDAALSDPAVAVGGGSIGTLILGLAGYAVRGWFRNRRHAAKNAVMIEVNERTAKAQETVAREAGAAAVVDDLLGEVRGYREEVRGLREQVATGNERCEELRRQDRAEMEARIAERDRRCEERLDALRADLGYVAAHQLRETSPDDTGVHQLARIARRTPTPPGGTPAQPEPALMVREASRPRTLADVPPPRRGKGD